MGVLTHHHKLTLYCHRKWLHPEAQRMHIPLLRIAGDRHAGSEEGDVPDEGKQHSHCTVLRENADGSERIDHSETERHDIGHR